MKTDLWVHWAYKVHIRRLKLMGLLLARWASLPDTGYLNSRANR